jgi:hypothetical protein
LRYPLPNVDLKQLTRSFHQASVVIFAEYRAWAVHKRLTSFQSLDSLHESLVVVQGADMSLECGVPCRTRKAMDDADVAERNNFCGYGRFLGGDDDAGTQVPLKANSAVQTLCEKFRSGTIGQY